MDLKQNGFWVGIGAGVLVAVGAFAALVLPQWTAASERKDGVMRSHKTRLESIAADPKVPTPDWVSSVKGQDAALLEESKRLYQYFHAGDQALEAWFDESKEPPAKGVLMSKAADGIKSMMDKLRTQMEAKNVPPDGKHLRGETNLQGFEFVSTQDVGDDMEQRKYWMRVYNIHARMFKAMVDANAKRFQKVQFSAVQSPTEFSMKMKERPISNDLGSYIPFVFDCSLLWSDIPKLVASILNYDPEKPGPMFRIAMMRVDRDPALNRQLAPTVLDSKEIPEEEFDEASWKPTLEPAEMPMRVQLLIEAYNFNFPDERVK